MARVINDFVCLLLDTAREVSTDDNASNSRKRDFPVHLQAG